MGQVATTPAQAQALLEAVEHNQLEEVTSLMSSGVSPNFLLGETPALNLAIEKGHQEVASYMIDHGADVNSSRAADLQTPLHLTAMTGSEMLCEKLLRAGAKTDVHNKRSLTPLYISVARGYDRLVALLLNAGADANANYRRDGETSAPGLFLPLHEAVAQNQNAIGSLLCKHGAWVNARDPHGRTALHLAARSGDVDMVRLLIEYEACVDATDEDLVTPLHSACREGHVTVARALINGGCSVNLQRKGWGCERYTPLHEATQHDHGDVVKLLCWAQANVNAEDYYMKTPLHTACERGFHDIVKTLIAYGCDTNKRDLGGYTPIFDAVKQKHFVSVQALLRAMCDVEVTDSAGRTPLHHAAEKGMAETVDELLRSGARLNRLDRFRCTPLHYGICSGSLQCVFSILQHGHDLPKANCQVGELLQIVSTSKRSELFKLLMVMGWRPHANGFHTVAEFMRQATPLNELLPWIEDEERAPTCLLNLCRNVIRRSLLTHTGYTSTYCIIDKLKLPSDLLEFLQLKDLQDKFMLP